MDQKGGRYSSSRQKSCNSCAAAKTKCVRQVGDCARCAVRGLSCTYPEAAARGSRKNDESSMHSHDGGPLTALTTISASGHLSGHKPFAQTSPPPSVARTTSAADSRMPHALELNNVIVKICTEGALGVFDFTNVDSDLLCPINADDISNRWLNSYVPLPGQKAKEYPATITALIYRILKSYMTMTVRSRGVPPFIHFSQVAVASAKSPLSICLSMARTCENVVPGSDSAALEAIQREMRTIYELQGTYDNLDLLGGFQAYLLYTMILFFHLGQGSGQQYLRQAMMELQDIASSSSRRGVICAVEQERHARPKWESWIITEAKRRTLFTMYLFDSILSAQEGLPTFLGTELQGLPSPAGKSLWNSKNREEWNMAYDIHLVDWTDGGLHIDELWPIPSDLSESGLIQRRNRVDLWLEEVDEFGTLLYAVCSCTHGG